LLDLPVVAVPRWADGVPRGWPPPRLARLAADHDITPAAAEQAARMAQAILAGEGAWAWDAALIQTAINEAPLHYQGQSLRIDRLVLRRALQADDALAGWWVLDYKSATQPQRQQALVAQLQRYREAVSVLMPGEVVHAAFLTGDGRMVMVGGTDASAASAMGHTPAPGAASAAADVPALPAAPAARPGAAKAAPTASDSRQGSLF
jgi:ATP-dependent helicase/nuclease subunit A